MADQNTVELLVTGIAFLLGRLSGSRRAGKALKGLEDDVALWLAKPIEAIGRKTGFTARANWDTVSEVFGSFETVIASPARNHPTLHGLGDSDWKPASDLAAVVRQATHGAAIITEAEESEIRRNYPGYDHIYFGGPISHFGAKGMLGYRGTALQLRRDRRQMNLRWEYTYNVCELEDPGAEVLSYVSKKRIVEPNWEIFDCRVRKRLPPPKTSLEAGLPYLRTGYLLVTKRVHADGRIDVCVGGTHGIGTRQFGRLLLSTNGLLEELRSETAEFRQEAADKAQFQALFRLTDIFHDHKAKRTEAGGMKLLAVAKI